mgnify:CR=1 FL=1
MVADDLDGVLVGANGAVAAQTPELALDSAFGSGAGSFSLRDKAAKPWSIVPVLACVMECSILNQA